MISTFNANGKINKEVENGNQQQINGLNDYKWEATSPNDQQWCRASRGDISLKHTLHAYHFTLCDFDVGAYLGEGAHGNVFLARERRTGFVCVLKAISKAHLIQTNQETLLKKEIELQAHLKHPHICTMYAWFEIPSAVFLVLEYCYYGDLLGYLEANGGRLPEHRVAQILFETTWAFRTCHDKRIAHLDLKPENVFIDHRHACKLADFGLSAHIGSRQRGKVNAYRGTYDYWSPEQCLRATKSNHSSSEGIEFGYKTDIWTLAVLAFELYCGFPPFGSSEEQHELGRVGAQRDLKERIINDPWYQYGEKKNPQLLLEMSSEFREFLDSCFKKNPDERPTADSILRTCSFLRKYETKRLKSQGFLEQPRGNNAIGHLGFNQASGPYYTPTQPIV